MALRTSKEVFSNLPLALKIVGLTPIDVAKKWNFNTGEDDESQTISQKNVRQMQNHSPQTRGSHYLRKPKTQAKAGLSDGSYCRCGFTQEKKGGVWIDLYLWYRFV